MILYSYWRSSASYRVRIVLEIKGARYEQRTINLLNDRETIHLKATNQYGLVPVLFFDNTIITQSLAIIEYLEEMIPTPSFLPKTIRERARVRSIALSIACEVHPLCNIRVKEHFKKFGHTDTEWLMWYHHWIQNGFKPLEHQLQKENETGTFCHGETPTLADICLIPQVYNAKRFNIDLDPYPKICQIYDACMKIEAFKKAAPENQSDAVD